MIQLEENKYYHYRIIYNVIYDILNSDFKFKYRAKTVNIIESVFNFKIVDENENFLNSYINNKVYITKEHILEIEKQIALIILQK